MFNMTRFASLKKVNFRLNFISEQIVFFAFVKICNKMKQNNNIASK